MKKTVYRFMSFIVAFALAFGGSSQALAEAALSTHPAALLGSNVYYVSTTGNDNNSGSSTSPFKTFAKAVSVLVAGDTLQVMAGTYYETLTLAISGTATAPLTVIGNGAILNMQGAEQFGIKISGSYINVSNFQVIRATGFGIYVTGKYVTVEDNILHDNVTENGIGTCGLVTSWGSALKVKLGGEHAIIRNNKIYNNCGDGIAVTRGVATRVENNTTYDNFGINIYVDNSPFTTVQNNLSYCKGTHLKNGNRASGITLGEEFYSGWGAQMHDILVSGNTIRGCGKGIGASASQVGGTFTNVTITENSVTSGQNRAIALSTSPNANVVISYNTIFNDVYLSDSTGITLVGNTIIIDVNKERTLNGGFNSYPTLTSKIPINWNAVNFSATDGKNTTYKKQGIASVRISGTGISKTLSQTQDNFSGLPGDLFTFSFWVKGSAVLTAGVCRGEVFFYNGPTLVQTKTVNCPTGIYEFQKKTITFNANAAYTKVIIKFTYSKASGSVWFDAVSLVR